MNKQEAKVLRKIGRVLDFNKMETIPPDDEKAYNPLYNVWVYKDEIKALKNGTMPEDW